MESKIEVVDKKQYTLVKTNAALGSAIAAGILRLSPVSSTRTTTRIPLLYMVRLPTDEVIEVSPHIVKLDNQVYRVTSNDKELMLTKLEADLVSIRQKVIDLRQSNPMIRLCVYRDPNKGPVDWIIDVKNRSVVKIIRRWMFAD